MTVEPYTPDLRRDWNDFVARSRTPHLLLHRDYMEYHADRFIDASLVVREEGKLVALLPASRADDVVTSHGGLTFGGLVTSHRMGAERMLDATADVLDHLRGVGVARLAYRAMPHIYHVVPAEEDLFALTRAGAQLTRRDQSSAIDLREPFRYAKGRRQRLASALAAGLVVEPSDDYDTWHAVESATLEAYGVPPVHSADELRRLAGLFPDDIALRVVREHADGDVLAVGVLYLTPVVAHVQYLGQTAAGRDVGAMDVLVDHMLREQHDAVGGEAARRWFDLGTSSTDGGRELNRGLAAYKETFGARTVCFDHYEIDLTRG